MAAAHPHHDPRHNQPSLARDESPAAETSGRDGLRPFASVESEAGVSFEEVLYRWGWSL